MVVGKDGQCGRFKTRITWKINETEEGLKRRAYIMGLELKNSNLDKETIYARLEKKGIPAELAWQVADDIMIERKKTVVKEEKPRFYTALIGVITGVILAIVSAILIPGKNHFTHWTHFGRNYMQWLLTQK
ncbi:MAG: hypothetical protein R3B93_24425 [Bacteroidia bacterium]